MCVLVYLRWESFPVGVCPRPVGECHLWWTHRQSLWPPHLTLIPGAVLLCTSPTVLSLSWSEKGQRRNARLSTSDQPPKLLLHIGKLTGWDSDVKHIVPHKFWFPVACIGVVLRTVILKAHIDFQEMNCRYRDMYERSISIFLSVLKLQHNLYTP